MLTYRKPTIFITVIAVILAVTASFCLLTDPVSARNLTLDSTVKTEKFTPQQLTELYFDIDNDGTKEYLKISDPTTANHRFSPDTKAISIYKEGYKIYYNIFMPAEHVSEMYFEVTDEGKLKIARQYKGEWELSDISIAYLREGRIVIESSKNIRIDGGMLGAYSTETHRGNLFSIDTAVIVDIGVEDNISADNQNDGSLFYKSMEYIVVKPCVPETQLFEGWEGDTFRFWIGEQYTNDELLIGDTVKIVHDGSWSGFQNKLGPVSTPIDISKIPSSAVYVTEEP